MSDIISKIEETTALLKAEGEDILPKYNQNSTKKKVKKPSEEEKSNDISSCVK